MHPGTSSKSISQGVQQTVESRKQLKKNFSTCREVWTVRFCLHANIAQNLITNATYVTLMLIWSYIIISLCSLPDVLSSTYVLLHAYAVNQNIYFIVFRFIECYKFKCGEKLVNHKEQWKKSRYIYLLYVQEMHYVYYYKCMFIFLLAAING